MEKCRLCLGNKKNLQCIFDVQEGYTYAYKITCISNVEIKRDDGITDKICLGCRKKLKEFFEFKLLIEQSDAALQSSANCKKIKFDNLEDIKIKVEIAGPNECDPKHENYFDERFKEGDETISYNGTTIKRVGSCDIIKNEDGPLTVLDFLNNIKVDSDNNYDDDNYNVDVDYEPISDDDDEYLMPLAKRKALAKNKSKKKVKKKDPPKTKDGKNYHNYKDNLRSIPNPIKPVYMSDIRVLPFKKEKSKVPKKYYCYTTKKEMCNYCGIMTSSLKHHLLTHTGERSFKCEVCGKGFLTEASLRLHGKRHVDASQRTLKCEFCVATFASKESLRSHMISHSEEKKHVCDICNKPFKRRGAMRRHKLMHNVTNKNVKCELCNMSFFSKYGLNHHMRVHTGERPYNCEICSQPYSYKHDFNRHCLKKHGVFLKRRSVNVMNEEVLKRERALMRELMLKMHGFVNDGENINPFDGPQGAQAYEMAIKALKSKLIPIDLNM